MPSYKVNDQVFTIPDDKIDLFEADFPEVQLQYKVNDGTSFTIPANKRVDFLADFPDAQEVGWEPLQAPEPQTIASNETIIEQQTVPQEEKLRGFRAGARESWKGLKAGTQFAYGEVANALFGSSDNDANALYKLDEMLREGKDVNAEVEGAWTDAGREIRTGALEFLPGWMIKGWKDRVHEKAEQQKILDDIRDAIGEAGGDIAKARELLAARASDKSYGDIQKEKAKEKFADVQETEGLGAWVGENAVQMIPSASALIVGALTKSPGAARAIGMIGMGGMTAATAGSSMYEAREAGASDLETRKVGVVDGALEYITEKLPFDNYTNWMMGKAKSKVTTNLAKALRSGNAPLRSELEELLKAANKELGGKLFSKKNLSEYIADMIAEGASEFTAEASQTMTKLIYDNPDIFPLLGEAVSNGMHGALAGFFMGGVLGGAATTMEHQQHKQRRKEQGHVDVGVVDFGDGQNEIVEILSVDDDTNRATVLHNGAIEYVDKNAIGQSYRYSYEAFEAGRMKVQESEAIDNGNVTEGQIKASTDRMNAATTALTDALRAAGTSEEDILTIIESEQSQIFESDEVQKAYEEYIDARNRSRELTAAYNKRMDTQRGAKRLDIEEAVGEQFWRDIPSENADGVTTWESLVTYATLQDGRRVYLFPSIDATETAGVTEDGQKVFVTPDMLVEGSEVTESLDAYLDNLISDEKKAAEQERMSQQTLGRTNEAKVAAQPGSQLNIGTAEEPVVGTVVQTTPDGVIVQSEAGVSQLSWEEYANAMSIGSTALTDEENASLEASEILSAESSYKAQQTTDPAEAENAVIEGAEAQTQAQAANIIPVKADGSVDQTTLWNQDPERWAQWNDEQRQDGGVNSLAYITTAIKKESAALAKKEKTYNELSDFVARDQLEQDIKKSRERLARLAALQQKYAPVEEVTTDASTSVQTAPTEVVPTEAEARSQRVMNTISSLYNDESLSESEIEDYIAANVAGSQADLDKHIAKAPKMGRDLDKYKADKEAHDAKTAELTAERDFWKEVQDYNTIPETEMDMEPQSALEFTANELARKDGIKLQRDSFIRHTGYGSEAGNFLSLLRTKKNGGLTLEEAGERLMEMDRENNTGFFDQNDPNAGLNAILEVFGGAKTSGDVSGYIRANREQMAREAMTAARNAMAEEMTQAEVASELEGDLPLDIFPDVAPLESRLRTTQSSETSGEFAEIKERAAAWAKRLGIKVNVLESIDQVEDAIARDAISRGVSAPGWFDPKTGEVYIYAPHNSNLSEVDKTVIHEVISHKGLRGLLGRTRFNALCDAVWSIMNPEAKAFYLNYENVLTKARKAEHKANPDAFEPTAKERRAAADEFIAMYSESVNVDKNAWQKMIASVKRFINKLTGKYSLGDQLDELIEASLARYEQIAKMELKGVVEEGATYKGVMDAETGAMINPSANEQAEGNTALRAKDGTLVGMHNISEDKLRKAIKQGGLANPSTAVVNIAEYSLEGYGDISLIMPSSLVDSETGDNAGTYTGDAWTPTYPTISRQLDDAGWKLVKDRIRAAVGESDDLYHDIVNSVDNYLSDDRNSRLEFVFLKEKGIEPKIEMKGADGYVGLRNLEAILGVEGLRDSMESYEKYKAASPMAKRSFNMWQRVGGEKKAHKALKDEIRQYPQFAKLMGLDEDLTFAGFDSFTYSIFRKEYDAGNVNTIDTLGGASRYVDANDMRTEFEMWLESLMEEAGAKEVFFAGWTRDGDRIYKDNTLENVSRYMRMQGRTNAYNDHGLSATKSALLQRLTSLAEIRKNRARLQDESSYNKAYDKLKDRLFSVISQLADMEKISDNPFMNIDYAEARLQEAIVKRNPISYLNNEYGYSIDPKGEYAEELKSFIKDVQKMPAKYFETKFERPVYLNEFAAAVMPNNTSEDVKQAITEAGLPIFEYDSAVEGARREATLEATEEEGVRFRILGEMGAANLDAAEEATTRLDNLDVARQMEEAGKDGKTIRLATGWERGVDNLWRYEVPDEYDLANLEKRLQEELDNGAAKTWGIVYPSDLGQLLKEYPDFNVDIMVWVGDEFENTGAYSPATEGDENTFGRSASIEVEAKTIADVAPLLAHEIQHAIQEMEGFAEGGQARGLSDKLSAELDKRVATIKQLREEGRNEEADELMQMSKGLAEAVINNEDDAYGNYKKLAGEVEARNAAKRIGMSLQERRESLLSETEDVAREDQIILMESLGVNHMADGNGGIRLTSSNASIARFDKVNGTDVRGFIDFLKNDKEFVAGKPTVFHIANAGDFLGQFGIKGKFMVGQFTFSRTHTVNADHELGVKEWIDVINNLNNPIAITSYKGQPNQFRIYTYATINGRNICVGVNVSTKDGSIELANIISAYGRDIQNLLGNESVFLLYPATIQELKQKISQVSTAHNSLLNATSSALSADKGSNNFGESNTRFRVGIDNSKARDLFKDPETNQFFVDKNIDGFNRWLKEHAEDVVRLYHGTGESVDVANQGLLRTTNKRRRSYQSTPGYVYLSLYPSTAQLFGELAYPYESTKVYAVDVKIKELKPDFDQLANKLFYDEDLSQLGNSLAESLIYGGGARVKRNILPYEISEDIRFRVANENQAIFVSNAAKAVEGIKQEKATPEQWLKMIEKNGGLKAGEDKWMGLSDWLKASDKKTLTKAEVLDFINENMIIIEEQHYSSEGVRAEADRILNENYPGWEDAFSFDWDPFMDEPHSDIYDEVKAARLYNETHEDQVETDEDGDIVNDADYNKVEEFGAELAGIWYGRGKENTVREIHGTREEYTTNGLTNLHEIALTVPTIESWNQSDDIHFGDAGEGRAVAWIRFGETWEQRPSPQVSRKILVIDEIQSKRHQEGREKGYKDIKAERAFVEAKAKLAEKREALKNYLEFLESKYGIPESLNSERATEEEMQKLVDLRNAMYDADDELVAVRMANPMGFIPDAPFDKNWHELAMKRMLRYAAENGYDIIAWTKGDQQNQRYDLGGKVETIARNRVGENQIMVHIFLQSGRKIIIIVDNEGKNAQGNEDFVGKDLAEILGKEWANKVLSAEDGTEFSGDDLSVGGEGMRGFYDKMLPAFMNKYGKKWGVKVEDIELPKLENGLTMHSIPVTEEMKVSVMEGQVMFRMRGENESAVEFCLAVAKDITSKYRIDAKTRVAEVNEENAKVLGYKDGVINDIAIYLSDYNMIVIFAHEWLDNSLDIECAIFHEISHKYYDNPSLGDWLWKHADEDAYLADLKRSVIEKYPENEYSDAEREEELYCETIAEAMSLGSIKVLYEKLPQEYKATVDKVLNETRYDKEKEYIERIRRSAEGNSEAESGGSELSRQKQESNGLQSGDEKQTGEDAAGNNRVGTGAGTRLRVTEITPEVQDELDAIKASAIVMGNFMKAPNGQPTNLTEEQWLMVRTKSFKNWFGDWENDPENASKVVDENGEPKVVYHGTGADFTKFVARESDKGYYHWELAHFGTREQAEDVMRTSPGNKHIMEVFLNIRKPYRISDQEGGDEWRYAAKQAANGMFADQNGENADGLVYLNMYEGKTPADSYAVWNPSQIKSATDNTGEFSEEEGDIRYRVVTDPAKIEELENGEKIKVYRAMQLIDGKLYPPMSAKVDGQLREPIELGQWEESEERPDLADNKGYFKLDKGNKKSLKARYNPYFHTSYTPLNDQFSEAQDRPNLVTVEVEIPVSELTSGYKADKAKDSVGEKEWKAGVIQGKLSGTRKVILSRWDKPIRIVPDSEVADVIVKMFEGKDIVMPSNVVTPSLRAELESRGVPFVETDNQGKPISEFGPIYELFKGKPKEAVEFLMKKKTGEAVGALNHKDIGDISIVYGNEKAGLKKIAVKHPEVLDILQDILDEATIVQQSENRIKLESGRYFAVISKDYLGKPRAPWLLTSFEKKNSVPDNTMDTGETSKGSKQNDTATLQDTVSESKDSDNIDTSNELDENTSFRTTGTPTEDIVAEGVSLSPAQLASLAGDIFAALPEDSRKKITDGLNGNVLGLQDAILQIPTSLATKENWNDEDRQMAEVVAEQMTKAVGKEMTRPFSASEALWTLYNAVNKSTDLVSEASRALVRRNLGFDSQTLEMEDGARDGVRFRTVGDASANAQASMYNRGAANVRTRLKEVFVDMHASVEKLVKAIEKKSGKIAQGFENVLIALNQQSSKGLAAMEAYEQKFLNKMFDEISAIMDKTDFRYEDIVRYVILKHGLERNIKLAQRDAKAHYQEIYDDIIAKINGMNPAQKRTYLTNAQLRDADAKAEIARLQGVNTSALTPDQLRDHKKELAKAKKEASEAAEHLVRAQKIATMTEQDALDELDKIFKKIEKGTDSVYKEMRKNDYSGISSMFYDTLGEDRKNYATEEEYQSALMQAKADKYDTLGDIEGAAQMEVTLFENEVNTDNLWKSINNATKETLRQQYEANMISKDQYDNLRTMFEFYVPLRGFKDNTAEDMYTYYRRPNSTGYTKPILGAEGRKTEAESPFGWIAAMAGSAIASNVKNEAKLALYYFVANRPDNGVATLSRTWFVHTPGDVDANGKKIFRPAYPPFNEDLSTDAAKQAYEDWQDQMRDLQKQGLAYEAGQRLNLGNSVVNISDTNKPEHIVNVKVGGKDYTIVINGNPRAAQAINGDLNIESSAQDYSTVFGPMLRWMSSVNTSYNPEFWITNMMRDMAFTMMAVNIKEDPAYRRKFKKNYAKAFKVISMVAKNEKGTLGNSYIENMYKDFVKYGGVTGYTQIKDSETWEKEIENYLASNDPASLRNGKVMRGMKSAFHAAHRFGESLEQVSRFAAFLTAVETGKSINEAINDAKEITVNFNRKGSGKMITLEEAKYLTDRNGQPLNKLEQWAAVGFSSIAPLGRRFIMFFNAAIQGLNATYKLYAKNKIKAIGWALGYAAVGMMNAVLHAMLDDDDDYLDIPQYERRTSLMIGGNGAYFKWALPQEARAFYALGDLAVESVMGRNPHQSVIGEALKISTEILPINPVEGWKAFMPSVAVPVVELALNEDYKGSPIYNEQKWLTEEERKRSTKWSKAYSGTGDLYIGIAKVLNAATGGDEHDAGLINLQPEKMEHLVQSAFGGTIRTADKFISTIMDAIDPEEKVTVRQFPFLNRFLTINDERYKNVHVNDVYDYYAAEAEHVQTLLKQYTKDRDADALKDLKSSDEYKWARIYSKYKKPIKKYQEKIRAAEGTAERMELMKQQDELKRKMIKEISDL